MLTIRDWSGGMNNRKDPRDIAQNESSGIVNMSIDALGKIKTAGGLYAHSKDTDGSATLPQYIVERAASIAGAGGYGLFYFEADHSRDSAYNITDTKHPGSSNALTMGFTDNTCDYNNDPTITHDANGSIVVGLHVKGSGIPTGAFIASITSSTEFELSASTTGGSVTNGTLSFFAPGNIFFTGSSKAVEGPPALSGA